MNDDSDRADATGSQQVVDYHRADGIATVRLNNERKRNVLSMAMRTQLAQALQEAAADEGIRAVRLCAAGPVFCAGADMSEAARQGLEEGTRALAALLRQIVELPKPVLADVRGTVRAGGIGLIAACDIVLCTDDVSFAFTEARLGLAPASISLAVLPRIDQRSADRYFLTGEAFDASTAAGMGLISAASPLEEHDRRVSEVTAALLAGSPQGLAESKRLSTKRVLAEFDAHTEEMTATSARLFGSEEAREGMQAFLEKRPPRWAQ